MQGHADENVPVDLSKMSPADRARLSALIERDGDSDLRQHLLGAVGRSETARGARGGARELPDRWTIVHCLDRLEEAYQVLGSLPAATRPKAFGSAWPSVVQEKIPLVVQAEMAASGELEVQQADKNRVRLPPTTAQITRMEQALRWPFEYLGDRPALARAINQKALWSAMRIDIKKRCLRLRIPHDEFNILWQEGLKAITQQLIARKVPVS
jgi:hypothetical protein